MPVAFGSATPISSARRVIGSGAVHLEQRDDLEPDDRQPVRLASRGPSTAVVGEERRQRVDDLGGAVAGEVTFGHEGVVGR